MPDDVKSRCLSRMQAWAKLAAEVVRAEHPDFEVVQCFSVFSLKDFPKMTSESIRQDGLPTVFDDAFHRLAGVFGVNATELKQEFFDIGSIALARFHDAGCTNVGAWAWAMDATSASVASRRKHPVGNLELVMSEYACMSASDSVIERDFSRIKAILREQQLNGSEAWESDYIIIAQSDSEFDKDVVGLAKQVWQELYAPCRKRMKPRFDKGTVKTKVPEKDDTLSPEKQKMRWQLVHLQLGPKTTTKSLLSMLRSSWFVYLSLRPVRVEKFVWTEIWPSKKTMMALRHCKYLYSYKKLH